MVKLSQPFDGFLGSPIFLFAQLSSGAEGSDVQDIERVFNALSQLPAVLPKIEKFFDQKLSISRNSNTHSDTGLIPKNKIIV